MHVSCCTFVLLRLVEGRPKCADTTIACQCFVGACGLPVATQMSPERWEPARPLQRSLGPSGPEIPKKSRKCLPGPPAPGPQKVSKKSRGQSGKSPESLRKVSGECFWTVPGTFWRLKCLPGPEAPGDILVYFFGISGPEGPRDLCKGRAGSQPERRKLTN